MQCFLLIILSCWYCSRYRAAIAFDLLPPPLLVRCSNLEHHVYQRQDNELRISCLWNGNIEVRYCRAPGLGRTAAREEADLQPPPHCRWYRDSILVNNTNSWSGHLVLGPRLPGQGPHPPWALSQITVQCMSALCNVPVCLHHNLSIEFSVQDIRLFLLQPPPIFEWQPVQLGWCARLKSSTWSYHFSSRGGIPSDATIPSNQHNDPPPSTAYPNAQLHQVCESYYSYSLNVHYPHRGFYVASIRVEHEPQISLSVDLFVQPALLHIFSMESKLQSMSHLPLSLSWSLLQLSQGIVAYKVLDMHATGAWSHSYNYNPFALQSNFCAAHITHQSKEKILANIYFRTKEVKSEELKGKLHFFNSTLIIAGSSKDPTYLILSPQKVKMGTYIFSPTQELHYSILDHFGTSTNASAESSSMHYIFYQQDSLSYLIVIEFVQLQWYRFSMHTYLNRRGPLFKSLGEKDIEIHLFNSSSPQESLVSIVWFIPIQHPLLQCEWIFSLQLFDSKEALPFQTYTYRYEDHVRNAIEFIPSSVIPFSPSLYVGYLVKVKCPGNGHISFILKCTVNTFASKVIKSTVVCEQAPCSITKISIQRPDSSHHILYYAPSSEVLLAAVVQIDCPGPKQSDAIWNIYKIPDRTTIPNWSKPLSSPGIERKNLALKVPAYSLGDGLYLFNFTITLTSNDTQESVEGSDSVLVQIGSNNLVAVIAGGSFRSVGFSDEWTLNGSLSSDDGTVHSLEGLLFTWYCTKEKTDYIYMRLSGNGKCHADQVDLKWLTFSDPVQKMQPETLQGNTTYYFRLLVQNGSRYAEAEQTIHVVHLGFTPILSIRCIENCGRSVIPTERFCLSGKCMNCRSSKPRYYWSLLSAHSTEISFDWSSKTTTGRFNPYIRLRAFAFISMADELYIFSLKVITKEGQSAVYKYSFYVTAPPRIGKCILNPRIGVAFLTKFIVQCNGFDDTNGPLTYKVIAALNRTKISTVSSIGNNTLGIIVYAGYQHKTPPSFLPVGMPSQNFALTVYAQVYDVLGAFSQVTLQAIVHDERKRKPTDVVLKELHGLIIGPRAPVTTLLVRKDYINVGYFAYMVASVLNTIETSPSNQDFKTDLQGILLNVTTRIPIIDEKHLNQLIWCISEVTQEISQVSRESQLLVVRKLKEASEALKRLRDKRLGSKETEVLGTGVLAGLSNLLKATSLDHSSVTVVQQTLATTETLAELVLQSTVPGEQETILIAKGWKITLKKGEKWNMSRSFAKTENCRNCLYPKLNQGHLIELPVDAVVSLVFYEFDSNPFPWLLDKEGIGTMVTGFRMKGTKPNGETIRIEPDVAEIVMARKDEDSAIFDLTIGPDKKLPKTTGGFSFEMKRNTKDIFIQIVTKIEVTFQVFIFFGLNTSHSPISSYTASPTSPPTPWGKNSNITDCAVKVPYIICLPWALLQSSVKGSTADKWNISVVLQSPPIVRDQTTKIVRIAVFTANCLDLDSIQSQWEEETCKLGPQTGWSKVHCICKDKARSMKAASPRSSEASELQLRFLAGKVDLFSKYVDMKKGLFEDFHNLLTVVTILAIFLVYALLATRAIKQDKNISRDQIISLPDNDPFHTKRYVVTIYTGSRFGGGTSSDVFIELVGQKGASDVHHLNHPQFPGTLSRGSIDTFLLTTKKDLGDITLLHLWHNNRGFFAAWYLSRVKVQRMNTEESWVFICRKWLAINKDDGRIERSFVVTDPKAPLKKMDYFLISVFHDLFENHQWFSVFALVNYGSNNRFKRLSCGLAVLLSSLLLNTVYFSTEKNKHVLSVNLRYLRAIIVGISSALISVPVQLSLTALCKFSQKKTLSSNTAQTQPNEKPLLFSGTPDKRCAAVPSQQLPPIESNFSNYSATEKEAGSNKTQKLQQSFLYLYLPWAFVIFISCISSFFIIFYGLSFSSETSSEWLIAFVMSFCQNVFVLQTSQIVIFSAWGTISAKYCENLPWSHGKSYQESKVKDVSMPVSEMRQLRKEVIQARASKLYLPLKEDEIIILKKKEDMRNLAYSFIKDAISHLIFLNFFLTIIASSTDISSSFIYNRILHNRLSRGISEIGRMDDIYMWVENVFVPLVHNDDQPTYLSETWSKILGLPRMRQVRPKDHIKYCFFPDSDLEMFLNNHSHCNPQYGTDPEDQTDYLGSWTLPANSSASDSGRSYLGFKYSPNTEQGLYYLEGDLKTYGPGGYNFDFFPEEQRRNATKRMQVLEENFWIDESTWAVIFELTTFNEDENMFCSIAVIFEISDFGFMNKSLSVHSYKLPIFSHQTKTQIFVFAVTIYMLIFYIVGECRQLYRQRLIYFITTACVINLGIKSLATALICVLVYKFKIASDLVQFYLHHQDKFVSFHIAAEIDQHARRIMGCLAFLLFVKTTRYLRFLYRVRLVQRSMYEGILALLGLTVISFPVFYAFMVPGYLLFGQHEENYKTFIYAWCTVLSYCATAFRNTAFSYNQALGGVFLSCFMIVMICTVVNINQAVFIFSYHDIKKPLKQEPSHEADAMYILCQKVYRLWFYANNGTLPSEETDIFNKPLYGKSEKTSTSNVAKSGLPS